MTRFGNLITPLELWEAPGMKGRYQPNSISLIGGISMGTGVMIGAGIFALTGQIAQLAGPWFPLSFLAGAVVTGFSAYTYVKVSNAYPSAGGIAMILQKAYGPGAIAAALSLLMAFSMVISESLVARTFGSYLLRLFGAGDDSFLVPTLGVALILTAYAVNVSGSRSVGFFSFLMAMTKVGGIVLFALAALWAGSFDLQPGAGSTEVPVAGFMLPSLFRSSPSRGSRPSQTAALRSWTRTGMWAEPSCSRSRSARFSTIFWWR